MESGTLGSLGFEVTHSVLKMKVALLRLILCDPMDCTVHGTLQARILDWVASPFSSRSPQPRDRAQVPHTARGFVTT